MITVVARLFAVPPARVRGDHVLDAERRADADGDPAARERHRELAPLAPDGVGVVDADRDDLGPGAEGEHRDAVLCLLELARRAARPLGEHEQDVAVLEDLGREAERLDVRRVTVHRVDATVRRHPAEDRPCEQLALAQPVDPAPLEGIGDPRADDDGVGVRDVVDGEDHRAASRDVIEALDARRPRTRRDPIRATSAIIRTTIDWSLSRRIAASRIGSRSLGFAAGRRGRWAAAAGPRPRRVAQRPVRALVPARVPAPATPRALAAAARVPALPRPRARVPAPRPQVHARALRRVPSSPRPRGRPVEPWLGRVPATASSACDRVSMSARRPARARRRAPALPRPERGPSGGGSGACLRPLRRCVVGLRCRLERAPPPRRAQAPVRAPETDPPRGRMSRPQRRPPASLSISRVPATAWSVCGPSWSARVQTSGVASTSGVAAVASAARLAVDLARACERFVGVWAGFVVAVLAC